MQNLIQIAERITYPIRVAYQFLSKYFYPLRLLESLKFPAQVAFGCWVVLAIFFVTQGIARLSATASPAYSWLLFFAVALPITLLVPACVYLFLRSWIRPAITQPELHKAWIQGLDHLRSQRISPETPVFLMLGLSKLSEIRALVQSTQKPFRVHFPSQEGSELYWYASDDVVLLFLADCSTLSRLPKLPTLTIQTSKSGVVRPVPQPEPPPAKRNVAEGTIDINYLRSKLNSPSEPTMTISEPDAGAIGDANSNYSDPLGTLHTDVKMDGSDPSHPPMPMEKLIHQVPDLNESELAKNASKLEYIGSLLSEYRLPHSPVNGIFTLVPFQWIEHSSSEIARAIQSDLTAIQRSSKVLVPCSLVVTGMEREEGFQDLLDRIGTEKSKEFRFGKGCEVWGEPSPQRYRAIAKHAAGAFEDWVYTLFFDQLYSPDQENASLYPLLCRVRGAFEIELEKILVEGFLSHDSNRSRSPVLLAGCYFAATGTQPHQQAFMKSILVKMLQQKEIFSWSAEARGNDLRVRWLLVSCLLVSLISLPLIAILVWMILAS